MPERDWQKDWKWIESIAGLWEVSASTVYAFGKYWLQKVMEYAAEISDLEEENRKLCAVAEAVEQHIAWHPSHGPCCCKDAKILEALAVYKGVKGDV